MRRRSPGSSRCSWWPCSCGSELTVGPRRPRYTAFCATVVYFKAYVLPVAAVAVLAPMGLFLLPRSSGNAAASAPLLEERRRGTDPLIFSRFLKGLRWFRRIPTP